MKILIEVNSSDCRIGAINDVLDLCRYGKTEEVEFYLCGPLEDELIQNAKQVGFKIVSHKSIPTTKAGFILYIVSVVKWIILLSKIRPNVVHLNYVSWNPSIACAAKMMRIPIVARAGGEYNKKNMSCRWISRYLANCEAQAAGLLNSPLRDKVAVVGDLINYDRFTQDYKFPDIFRSDSKQRPRLLFLGQLVERKGIHILLESFRNMETDAELYIVGGNWADKGYPEHIQKMTKDYNLQNKVSLVNHRNDAINLIRQCDVFVLPSLSEARPRSIIESMILGKCVVATNTGGIPTLIKNNETGLLVEPGNIAELTVALEKVSSSSKFRDKLAAAAKEYAANELNPVSTASRYLQIYKSLV